MDRRTYSQYCGVARALDVVGERWTLLIIRDLLLGPRRYSELLRGLPGITTNLLAKRLREMEAAGLLERIGSASDVGQAYRLTSAGLDLEPVVQALATWGWRDMHGPGKGELRNFEWMLVPLRPRYRGGTPIRAELVVDGAPYRIILDESTAEIARGEVSSPTIRLRGSASAIYRMFRNPPPRGRAPPGVDVEGPVDAVRTLVKSFAIEELSFA